jgi:chemotaxis protein histidine kinase CheA
MPYGFAENLFDKVHIGMRVIISPTDAEPVEFSHPALFAPNPEAIKAAPAKAGALAEEAAQAEKAAKDAKAAASGAPRAATTAVFAQRQLERQKTAADGQLASADRALAAANSDEAKVRTEDAKQKAAAKVAELATNLEAAKADAKAKQDALKTLQDAAKAAEAKRAETEKAALAAKLALEPVSVFISRATQKIYVRRDTHTRIPDGGERFDTVLELPITIRDPNKPLGTHVFTAMALTDSGGLRWTEVTIDSGDNAKDALDRVTIPQAVLDQVAPTAVPRSSIIVSDEPLNSETNYRTEFVVVLNDQPQGGLAVRRRPESDGFAANSGREGDGYGYARQPSGQNFFQRYFQQGW